MITLSIDGMSCENCARHVTDALGRLAGVSAVRVDLDRAEAEVDAGPEPTDEVLARALEEEGYAVTAVRRD